MSHRACRTRRWPAPHELNTPQLDRAAGALLGLAAGDALGAGYEFEAPPTGDAEFIGGGLGNWEPGEWTDDTQMAICIAEVAATGLLDATAVAERFLEWFATDPSDVGIQTRDVLGTASGPNDVAARARRRASPDFPTRAPATAASCARRRSRSRTSATTTRSWRPHTRSRR